MKFFLPSAVRRLGALASLSLAALAMSGCVVIKSQDSTQLNQVGNVQLTTTLCASSDAVGSTCTDKGNANGVAADSNGQILVGYRIPSNSTEPASITSTNGFVQLSPSASYASELQRLLPVPAGQKWVGYISGVQNFTTGGTSEFTVAPEFGLVRGADGSPFVTPFRYRTVVGVRLVGASALPTRPVNCGATLIDATDGTVCGDSPSPIAAIASNLERSTRDLGLLSAAPVTAAAGTTAQLSYTARYSGSSAAAVNFTLAGTTTVPGTIATPNAVTLIPPANADTTVVVNVPIPVGTAPGTYTASLTATLLGQTRTATGQITVPAPPVVTPPVVPPTPTVVVTVAKLKLSFLGLSKTFLKSRLGGKGVSFRLAPNRDASVSVKLIQGGKIVLIKKLTVRKPSSIVLLKSAKVKKGKVTVVVTGTGLNLTRTVTVK